MQLQLKLRNGRLIEGVIQSGNPKYIKYCLEYVQGLNIDLTKKLESRLKDIDDDKFIKTGLDSGDEGR